VLRSPLSHAEPFLAQLLDLKLSVRTHTFSCVIPSSHGQVEETMSEEALGKMGAPAKNADVPVLDPNDLANAGTLLSYLQVSPVDHKMY
jgi:hypothetical protein